MYRFLNNLSIPKKCISKYGHKYSKRIENRFIKNGHYVVVPWLSFFSKVNRKVYSLQWSKTFCKIFDSWFLIAFSKRNQKMAHSVYLNIYCVQYTISDGAFMNLVQSNSVLNFVFMENRKFNSVFEWNLRKFDIWIFCTELISYFFRNTTYTIDTRAHLKGYLWFSIFSRNFIWFHTRNKQNEKKFIRPSFFSPS